jgi:hypothetical protein
MFINDYDGIQNCNGLKYSPFEKINNFWLINSYGDQIQSKKRLQ